MIKNLMKNTGKSTLERSVKNEYWEWNDFIDLHNQIQREIILQRKDFTKLIEMTQIPKENQVN